MEIVKISDEIMRCITALGEEGKRSQGLIEAKATAMAEYDKMLAVAITTLKAQGEPTTIIPKLANGNVSDLFYKRIIAEEGLKAHYSRLERLGMQLNALQSILRHLENATRGQNGY